ncbi:MAG: bifunctional lysylphosphatidylglycerol flippase/synthetase MprF, partial [Planctomycetota bacterium]|nr:bifunctional lysylphosphatidylglycerol flippase/synthetase MprF [Planctomycetota bacterium]
AGGPIFGDHLIVPRFLAACTFLSGVMLLFSGATPIRLSRAPLVESWIPLSVVEVSHFLGSIIGASLLLIALGLNRRLDSAWWFSIVLAMSGVVVSILKGLDFEEAILMATVAFVLVLCRKSFYRRGQLVNQALSRDSFYAIALVMLCAGWLAVFSHKNTDFSASLWWDFSFPGDASRMLRGGVAALCVLMLFAVRRLLVPHCPQPTALAPVQSPSVQNVVRSSPAAGSALALLGDKNILFNPDHTGFVMYAVQGRSWISMRDPVGPRCAMPELAWSFRSLADEHAGWPVFYQVGEENLPVYLDQGLTLLKLGEEARVPLVDFTMDGPSRRNLRRTYSRLQRLGCTFEVVPAHQVHELLPELRNVSGSWLDNKKMNEKGFSLGYFDESYLVNFPCGVVRLDGQVMAFSNLWCSADQEEVTSDLMRYRPDSPSHIMEYLLVESLLWAQQNQYHWFSLGMAPLSGISDRPLAPLWNRAAGLVFRHGDQLYNFEGLREFKERFSPVWVPKYLASPGGWSLPRVLADVALLIARRPPPGRTLVANAPLSAPHLPLIVGQL